jgi:hypothetical protein
MNASQKASASTTAKIADSSSKSARLLQRKCACGGSSASILTGECEECKTTRLQKKLAIGASNDPLEQEADRVADQVMAMSPSSEVNRAPLRIQRFSSNTGSEAGTAPASVDRVLASSGRPLDPALQQDMGRRFGYDFSHVRIHTGAEAGQSARDVNAYAYTVGPNIVFGALQYQPHTIRGKRLLAHELAHTVQQEGDVLKRRLQRLAVSAVGSPHNGACGGFTRSFDFMLDKPAPTDGYMVQKIERYENKVRCPGLGSCPANPSLTYYEAFFVRQNSREFYRHTALGMTDQSGHASQPNTSGARYAHGEIRFFPVNVTGNLGRNNVAGLWSPGNAGGVPPSLSLPSTQTTPTWWNSNTEGPARRYVQADWRCCGDANDFNVVKSSPT